MNYFPFIQKLLYINFIIGNINFKSKDPRINYLKNSLLIEEEKLSELGIKLGILGHPRVNYDITLVSIEDQKILTREIITEAWERKKTLTPDKPKKSTVEHQHIFKCN